MPAIITEDQIEQGIVQRLQHLYGYDALDCNTSDPAALNDGSGCRDKREVILHDRLKRATDLGLIARIGRFSRHRC